MTRGLPSKTTRVCVRPRVPPCTRDPRRTRKRRPQRVETQASRGVVAGESGPEAAGVVVGTAGGRSANGSPSGRRPGGTTSTRGAAVTPGARGGRGTGRGPPTRNRVSCPWGTVTRSARLSTGPSSSRRGRTGCRPTAFRCRSGGVVGPGDRRSRGRWCPPDGE